MELHELQWLFSEGIYIVPEKRILRPFQDTFPPSTQYLCIFGNEADYKLKNKENKGVFERMIEALAKQQKASTPIHEALFTIWLAEEWLGQRFDFDAKATSLQKVICFGVDLAALGLPTAPVPYQVCPWADTVDLVQADSLALIEKDASLKKALWAALVQMFP